MMSGINFGPTQLLRAMENDAQQNHVINNMYPIFQWQWRGPLVASSHLCQVLCQLTWLLHLTNNL
jgi:hypothetical protein